jgi:hypothetical protein
MPRPAVIRFSSPGLISCLLPEAVTVQHQALEKPADGLQADVRVRWDLHAGTPAYFVGPVVVQEAPRADDAYLPLRQQPADLRTVTDGGLAGLDDVHRRHHARRQRDRLRGRIQIAHFLMLSLTEPD